MKIKKLALTLGVASFSLVLGSSSQALAVTFTSFTPFDISGASSTTINGINSSGAIVGTYVENGTVYGFSDSSITGQSYTSIAPSGTDSSRNSINGVYAYGISDSGTIVGGYTYNSDSSTGGFLDANGPFTYITDPSGANAGTTVLSGISGNGQNIVGNYTVGTTPIDQSFLYSTNSGTTPIANPNATTYGIIANGINNSGEIVGSYYDNGSGNLTHGFSQTTTQKTNSTISSIDDPNANATYGTTANAINNLGQIVGSYAIDNDDDLAGFLYSNGQYTSITSSTFTQLAGATSISATGINDNGQIVGYYTDANGTHGFETSIATSVPFDFSPTQGVFLGIPLFFGLRIFQKKRKLGLK